MSVGFTATSFLQVASLRQSSLFLLVPAHSIIRLAKNSGLDLDQGKRKKSQLRRPLITLAAAGRPIPGTFSAGGIAQDGPPAPTGILADPGGAVLDLDQVRAE
jgi:hypothetical protein